MAKINCEYDSATKQMMVTIDGVAVDNVEYFCVYCYGENNGGECSIETKRKDENGIKTYTRLSAFKNEKGTAFDSEKTLSIEKLIEKQDKK